MRSRTSTWPVAVRFPVDFEVNMLENALEQLKLQRQGALETKRLALVEAEALVEDKRLGASRAGEAVETQREALLEAKLRLAEVTKEVIRSRLAHLERCMR